MKLSNLTKILFLILFPISTGFATNNNGEKQEIEKILIKVEKRLPELNIKEISVLTDILKNLSSYKENKTDDFNKYVDLSLKYITNKMGFYSIEAIFKGVSALPNDEKFNARRELAGKYIPEKVESYDIKEIFLGISALPNDEKLNARGELAGKLISEKMDSFNIREIFKGISALPNDETFNARGELAGKLITENMDSYDIKEIFSNISALPNDEKFNESVELLGKFIIEKMSSFAIKAIFEGVFALPNDEKLKARGELIGKYITEEMGASAIEAIFTGVSKIPNDDKFTARVKLAEKYIAKKVNFYNIKKIFLGVSALPNDEKFNERIELAGKLITENIDSYDIKEIFKAVSTLPNDKTFNERIELAGKCMTEKMNPDQIAEIFSGICLLSSNGLNNLLKNEVSINFENVTFYWNIRGFFTYFLEHEADENLLQNWANQLNSLSEMKIKPTNIHEIEFFPLFAAGADLKEIIKSIPHSTSKRIENIIFAFLFPSEKYQESFGELIKNKKYSRKHFLPLIQKEKDLEQDLEEKLDSMNSSLSRLCGEFLENRVPEESRLGQKVIQALIRVANQNDTRSAYGIHKKLLQKREEIIEYSQLIMTQQKFYLTGNMWGENLQIDPCFASKKFIKLELTKDKLPEGFNTFLNLFNSYFGKNTSLTKFISQKNLDNKLKDELSAIEICQRFLQIDQNAKELPLETFYMASIMNHVLSLSSKEDSEIVQPLKKDNMEDEEYNLSPQEDFLARLMFQMQKCPKGKKGGIEDMYYQLPAAHQFMGHVGKISLSDVLHQCIKEYLSDGTNIFYKAVGGLSFSVDPQEAIHQATYVQTLLSKEFNLNEPDFDIHCPQVYITLLMSPKKAILETFYRYFTPEEAIHRFTFKINELLKNPKDNFFLKCKQVLQTDNLEDLMDTKTGFFTHKGGAVLLKKMGFLKDAEEIIQNNILNIPPMKKEDDISIFEKN